jgi:L-malate glycosyltransferase
VDIRVMKIKILYLINTLGLGGTEKQLMELVKRLDRTRFEPYVFCLWQNEDTVFLAEFGCSVYVLNVQKLFSLKSVRGLIELVRFLKKENIDIVQTFFFDPSVLGVVAAKLACVPVVLTSRRDLGFGMKRINLFFMKLLNWMTKKIVVNSEAIKNVVEQTENVELSKIEVIHNGIDISLSDEEISRNKIEIRKQLKILSDAKVVGIVSNFNRKVKRVDLFIDAVRIIHAKDQSVMFVIVGGSDVTADQQKLEEKIAQYGLHGSVLFAGVTKEPLKIISAFDIAVNTSDSEGFSNSVIEYMLCGKAVVATDNAGNSELIDNDRNGLLVPKGDSQSIAHAILKCLNDECLCGTLGKNARLDVNEKFTMEMMIKNHEELYLELLSGKR